MTSGNFQQTAIAEIKVDRASRQRKDLTGIEELAESIRNRGLIHPILITEDLILVAGERRLEACRSLGWTHISTQTEESQDEIVLQELELEENIIRVDISWQDRVRALERYHLLRKSQDPNWTQEDTAAGLGWAQQTVASHLQVAKELKTNTLVKDAKEYSTARNITKRSEERAKQSEAALISAGLSSKSVFNEDFVSWAESYQGPRFNFLHCDFPYGINIDAANKQATRGREMYDDSPETYFKLIDALVEYHEALLAESAHIMFWFSMDYYRETLGLLSKAFEVNPFPLIWDKANTGVLPDPERGPRRVYETAFLCSYGDRKIVRAVSNLKTCPPGEKSHMSEKAQPMLEAFFAMLVDEHTVMLDPTCGSGSSLRAASALRAKFVMGLEINPEFALNAQRDLDAWRLKYAK